MNINPKLATRTGKIPTSEGIRSVVRYCPSFLTATLRSTVCMPYLSCISCEAPSIVQRHQDCNNIPRITNQLVNFSILKLLERHRGGYFRSDHPRSMMSLGHRYEDNGRRASQRLSRRLSRFVPSLTPRFASKKLHLWLADNQVTKPMVEAS